MTNTIKRHDLKLRRYFAAAAGLVVWLAVAHASAVSAPISVRDDAGNNVVLQRPAQRIVSLAPHVTEMIFAAGGGERIVGAVGYSDFPPAARDIPRVGDHKQIDIERIIALKPDLLVVWLHGNSERQLEHIRKLGIPLFYSEPHKLDDIPESIHRLGQLMGTEKQAAQSAAEQRQQLARLKSQYQNRPPVRVFYQVWGRPVYTLNGTHIISDMLRLCGGENIFAALPVTAPAVSTEAVLLENPEVMITGDRLDKSKAGLEVWHQYSTLLAVQRGNLFSIDADLLNRAGPRLLQGASIVCEKLELARSRRGERR
jgi:iron complex transport system substrate-binding protein